MDWSPIAEAVLQAHMGRASGWLTFEVEGTASRVLWSEGDVLAVEAATGHQTLAQALWQQGRIDSKALDALWARGEAATPSDETLTELGVDPQHASAIRLLSGMRRLCSLAQLARFDPVDVEHRAERLAGAWAVRAAVEATADPLAPPVDLEPLVCTDAEACGPWLSTEEEVALVSTLATPEGAALVRVPPAQRALVAVLTRLGFLHPAPPPPSPTALSEGEASWGELVPPDASPAEAAPELALSAEEMEPAAEEPLTAPMEIPIEEEEVVTREVEAPPGVVPAGATPTEDPLWKIVRFDEPSEGGGSGSFEEALSRIDVDLEDIVGQVPAERADPAPAPAEAPTWAASPAAPEPEPTTSPSAVLYSPEERKWADELQGRFAAFQQVRDPFRLLGVGRDVTAEQLKVAYLALVRQFHPDRVPAAFASLADQAGAVFGSIQQAYEVLTDPDRRAAYLKSETAPVPLSRTATQAIEAYKKGEMALRRRDFAVAEELFLQAQRLDAKAEYAAAAAWALYMDPARRPEMGRAKKLMQTVLETEPGCERAHYQLGVIARVEGDIDRAEVHFREVVKVNPKHLEANQELRLIEMRKRKKG